MRTKLYWLLSGKAIGICLQLLTSKFQLLIKRQYQVMHRLFQLQRKVGSRHFHNRVWFEHHRESGGFVHSFADINFADCFNSSPSDSYFNDILYSDCSFTIFYPQCYRYKSNASKSSFNWISSFLNFFYYGTGVYGGLYRGNLTYLSEKLTWILL